MEENPIHDKLDDYVNKSFEDYEENPSDDMWSRIESHLPEQERDRRPVFWLWRAGQWRWMAAAALLLLLGRWAYLEFQVMGPKKDITPQIVQNQEFNAKSIPNESKENAAANSAAHENSDNSGPTSRGESATTKQQGANAALSAKDTKKDGPEKPQTAAKTHRSAWQENPDHSKAMRNGDARNKATRAESTEDIAEPKAIADPSVPHDTASQVPPTRSAFRLAELVKRGYAPLAAPKMSEDMASLLLPFAPQALPQNPPKAKPSGNGFYFGLNAGPLFALNEKEPPVRQGQSRPRFGNQLERPTVMRQLGLQVGKPINRHFALETGLHYQKIDRSSVHSPQFEYRESRIISGSGGTESRSYEYDLNTVGGSAGVNLRMEVRGPLPPGLNDRIKVKITTREQIQTLQLPLLAATRLDIGRWQYSLKAGAFASYMLVNQLDIEKFELENLRLRPRQMPGESPFTLSYDRPRDFAFGYMAAAGVAYRFTENAYLQLTPSFQGEFAQKDSDGGKLPKQNLLGLSAGINWWF